MKQWNNFCDCLVLCSIPVREFKNGLSEIDFVRIRFWLNA